MRATLEAFPAYTTRKRMFMLFRWVVHVLNERGHPCVDPTPALEREFAEDERPIHAVRDLATQADVLARHALVSVSGWKGVRLAALVRLLADTGLRKEDLRGMLLAALLLDASSPTLTVPGPRGMPPRTLPLSPPTVLALQQWLQVRPACASALLFVADESGKAMDPATVWRQLKRLEAAVGEVGALLSGTTSIRAAFANQLRATGASVEEIQEALGHRQRTSTTELLDRIVQAGPVRRARRR